MAQSAAKRLFTQQQRLALIARDQGCTFPDCDTPPAWTEIHHIIAWQLGGTTTLDNAAMVCRFHHDHFDQLGWQCVYRNGRPAWIPPAPSGPRPETQTQPAARSTTAETSQLIGRASGLR